MNLLKIYQSDITYALTITFKGERIKNENQKEVFMGKLGIKDALVDVLRISVWILILTDMLMLTFVVVGFIKMPITPLVVIGDFLVLVRLLLGFGEYGNGR